MPDEREPDQPVPDERRPYRFGKGSHRPTKLGVAAALVALLGSGGLVWGAIWFVLTLTDDEAGDLASVMGAVFIVLLSAFVIRLAIALWQVNAWPRVPCIVISLMLVPIAYQLAFKADLGWIGIPVLIAAVAIIALLFSQDVREVFDREV